MTLNKSKDNLDLNVDDEIYSCLNLENPKSFFLFAGAGSGKTRSLVEVLRRLKIDKGAHLRMHKQQVAIITYTNAASDEIKHRLGFDSLFKVSTIHSFIWELIEPFTVDIKEWLVQDIQAAITELELKQIGGHANSAAAIKRTRDIISKRERLEKLDEVIKFTYSPNGNNRGKDSLNHTDVLKIGASFISTKPLMQQILIKKYPFLLIDESQDTNKNLITSFFEVQVNHKKSFAIGLFGDMMQRIFPGGKEKLGEDLNEDWVKPEKKMNFRCPKRVVKLINKIRLDVDGKEQKTLESQIEGFVRLFIADVNTTDKQAFEIEVCKKMKTITQDENWSETNKIVKTLTLEHLMAAKRMGFDSLFLPLCRVESYKTGLLDGSLQGIAFFTNRILPLIKAMKIKDELEVSRIIAQYSPLLDKKELKTKKNQFAILKQANDGINELDKLWEDGKIPALSLILDSVYTSKLFSIPDILLKAIGIVSNEKNEEIETDEEEDEEKETAKLSAWKEVLKSPFTQIEKYFEYISDSSPYGTHQGIKGLEFDRVMVILDDEEAGGNQFSYEKLFGAKEFSDNDNNNIKDGKDSTPERTKRLFYVTCSRAKKSLAIVAYTSNPEKVKETVLSEGWFENGEVEIS